MEDESAFSSPSISMGKTPVGGGDRGHEKAKRIFVLWDWIAQGTGIGDSAPDLQVTDENPARKGS